MNPVKKYCRLLGVSPGASVKKLQKAYKEKAVKLHAEVNRSSEAKEAFIEITIAFDFLYSIKSGIASSSYYYDYWEESQKEMRDNAILLAAMNPEEFQKWEYMKTSTSLAAGNVLDYFYFYTALLLIFAPVWGFLLRLWPGFFMGLLLTFLSLSFWKEIFTEKKTVNIQTVIYSLSILTGSTVFIVFVSILINGALLSVFMMNTEVSWIFLMRFFILLYVAGAAFYFFRIIDKNKIRRKLLFGLYIPLVFNLFFIINFVFSSGITIEKYPFRNYSEWIPGYGYFNPHVYSHRRGPRIQSTTLILLPENKYSDQPWLRLFLNYDAMRNRSHIEYEFATGLFGFRVVKNYKFTN